MSYQSVTEISSEQIPVIDIGDLFGQQPSYDRVGALLLDAVETAGFFYVANHCIDRDLVASAFAVSAEFFAQEEQQKKQVLARNYHRGLLAMGGSKMEGQARSDLKESFIWGVDYPADNPEFIGGNELLAPNRWPQTLPHMRNILNDYMTSAHRCGIALLRAIASSLGAEVNAFTQSYDRPITRGSLIHYPPQSGDLEVDQFGVSPHTDYGTLTLLAQDNNGGLRVQGINNDWLTAHPVEDTLVVNVGDLLARWSNDRFRSTPHSVVNSSGNERYSIAIAMDPNWDTVVRPVTTNGEQPHYPDVRCGDYIRGRFDRSFSYRKTAGGED